MNSVNFLYEFFKSKPLSEEKIVKFMIENYFLKGHNLDDLHDDLLFKYNKSEKDATDLKESIEETLKNYCKEGGTNE